MNFFIALGPEPNKQIKTHSASSLVQEGLGRVFQRFRQAFIR